MRISQDALLCRNSLLPDGDGIAPVAARISGNYPSRRAKSAGSGRFPRQGCGNGRNGPKRARSRLLRALLRAAAGCTTPITRRCRKASHPMPGARPYPKRPPASSSRLWLYHFGRHRRSGKPAVPPGSRSDMSISPASTPQSAASGQTIDAVFSKDRRGRNH